MGGKFTVTYLYPLHNFKNNFTSTIPDCYFIFVYLKFYELLESGCNYVNLDMIQNHHTFKNNLPI